MKHTPLARKTPLKGGGPLNKRSKSASARQRESDLRRAQQIAREWWGGQCIVCGKEGTELHHAFTRGAHPELRAVAENLWPLCRLHHDNAQFGGWIGRALRDASTEWLSSGHTSRERVQRILEFHRPDEPMGLMKGGW